MLYPNVETFIGCDSSYRAASIVLYGAPYDSTTSYRPGARFGPAAIRHESYGLETYSPYQNADLTDFDIFDSGDLELCFGSSESALADIQSRAAEILHDGKFPLLLGGEHLVTLGAVRAMVEKYPDLHISTLMPMPTCGTTIWAQSSATPVSCAAAMTSSATDASTSSASAAATAPSLSSRLPTLRCTSSISRALPSSLSSSVPARYPFT